MTNHTKLTTQNGTEVVLEHKYLDQKFYNQAIKYYQRKHKVHIDLNTYFAAKAVEEYICDNNLQPVYE
jgi:hypothetical protein